MEVVMAKTNAERQAEFKARMKAKGFREKMVWVDWEGHWIGAKSAETKSVITINQLTGRLKKIVEGMNSNDAGRLFSELDSYASGLKARWEINEKNMRKKRTGGLKNKGLLERAVNYH
jgi:hypothetical protein